MGIFSGKNKNKMPNRVEGAMPVRGHQEKYDLIMEVTPDDHLKVTLINNDPTYGEPNNVTTLIIKGTQYMGEGNVPVRDCSIRYTPIGAADILKLNPGQRYEVAGYNDILAEFDLNMLQQDKKYAIDVLINLLNEKRVERYLAEGMKENPSLPSGIYVGGRNYGEANHFYADIGKESHYSPEMQSKRMEMRVREENARKQEYRKNQYEISRLKERNKDLCGWEHDDTCGGR